MSLFRTAVTASTRALLKPNPSSRWFLQTLSPSSIAIRSFATTDEKTDFSKLLKNANPDRIQGIVVNPESVGNKILPGNLIYKKYKWSGNTRKVPMELEHGYFWMIGDLKRTENRPTLSNDTMIPESDAQHFPVLKGLKSLSGNVVDLPFCLMDNDGELDVVVLKTMLLRLTTRCTFVLISLLIRFSTQRMVINSLNVHWWLFLFATLDTNF
jgi:hypothetical protein